MRLEECVPGDSVTSLLASRPGREHEVHLACDALACGAWACGSKCYADHSISKDACGMTVSNACDREVNGREVNVREVRVAGRIQWTLTPVFYVDSHALLDRQVRQAQCSSAAVDTAAHRPEDMHILISSGKTCQAEIATAFAVSQNQGEEQLSFSPPRTPRGRTKGRHPMPPTDGRVADTGKCVGAAIASITRRDLVGISADRHEDRRRSAVNCRKSMIGKSADLTRHFPAHCPSSQYVASAAQQPRTRRESIVWLDTR